jgi:hypothetical protein
MKGIAIYVGNIQAVLRKLFERFLRFDKRFFNLTRETEKMKNASFLTALIIITASFSGCMVVNSFRHKFAPPNNSESPKPANNKPLVKANTENLITKAQELAEATFPLKLNPKAKAKGKILMIARSEFKSVAIKGFDFNGDDYYQFDLDTFGLKKETLAVKPDEIETVILKTCDKGKQIGQYAMSDGKKIPAFALDCKVSIIDYRIPAIVAEKKFPSKGMYDDILTSNSTKEWVAGEPSTEINAYIKNFPRE